MAEPAATRLLAHTGATITGVLGHGRFGTVFLVRRRAGSHAGDDGLPSSASAHYAAKVVLLEDRRDSFTSSGGSRSRYGSGTRSSPAPSTDSGRSSNTGSILLLAEDDSSSPVREVPGGARGSGVADDLLFVASESALPKSPSSPDDVPPISLSKALATLDPAVASLRREVDLLQCLRPAPGDHVVGFLGAHRNYECEALLMEYMEGGSMRSLLERGGALRPTIDAPGA